MSFVGFAGKNSRPSQFMEFKDLLRIAIESFLVSPRTIN